MTDSSKATKMISASEAGEILKQKFSADKEEVDHWLGLIASCYEYDTPIYCTEGKFLARFFSEEVIEKHDFPEKWPLKMLIAEENGNIISGLDASSFLKKRWNASDEEIKWWMCSKFTVLNTNKPDKNNKFTIERHILEREMLFKFFIKRQIEDFVPKDSNRLVSFSEILKRPFLKNHSEGVLRRLLRSSYDGDSGSNKRLKKILSFNDVITSLSLTPFEIPASMRLNNDLLDRCFFILEDILFLESEYGLKEETGEIKRSKSSDKTKYLFELVLKDYEKEGSLPLSKNAVAKMIHKLGIKKKIYDDPKSDKDSEKKIKTIERQISDLKYKQCIVELEKKISAKPSH